MRDSTRERINGYVLELLAASEKRNEDLETRVRELTVRATAAEIRLGDLEEEVRRLRYALDTHVISQQRAASPPTGESGETTP